MPKYKYAYSDFHELNLDYILKLCRESLGIGLKFIDKQLWLVNDLDEPLSKVTIGYSTAALTDEDGNDIRTYFISAGADNNKLVLTRGNGETVTIEIPYAKKAEQDLEGHDLTDYVYEVRVVGDQLRLINGKGEVTDITVPFAVKASTDENSKLITSYVATVSTDGDFIVVRDGTGTELNRFKCVYAMRADNDGAGNEITATYGHELQIGSTTVKLISADGTQLSEVTVPYAVSCTSDTDGNALLSDYAETLTVDGDRLALEAHDGTRLSTVTVPFAQVAEHSNKSVESVAINGNSIVFTTYDGTSVSIVSPYSVKALNDAAGNELTKTYVARVVNDTSTGEMTFYSKDGTVLAQITPRVDAAVHDSYNNLIADFIKTISTDPLSDYVTVTHGTGTVDAVKIEYSTRALSDSLNHQIHNHYIHRLACIEDVDDGHWKLAAYNGEDSLMWMIELIAYSAQTDDQGREITTYVGNVEVINNKITVSDGAGNIFEEIVGEVDLSGVTGTFTGDPLTPTGTVSGTAVTLTSGTAPSKAADTYVAPSLTYDAATEALTFNAGSFTEGAFSAGTYPAVDTVTDPTFTGTAVTPTGTVAMSGGTVPVDFDD